MWIYAELTKTELDSFAVFSRRKQVQTVQLLQRRCLCVCEWRRERACSERSVSCVCITAQSSDWEWMSSLCRASTSYAWHALLSTREQLPRSTLEQEWLCMRWLPDGSLLSLESTTVRLLMELHSLARLCLLMLRWHSVGETTDKSIACAVKVTVCEMTI